MPVDLKQDYFSLFRLPARFQLDPEALERAYRALLAEVHPDKFAHLPEAERLAAVQGATRVNEAYQTLRNPVERARYLLAQHGVTVDMERDTALPLEFLQQQMAWREAIEAARTARARERLDALERKLRAELQQQEQELAHVLEERQDYLAAAMLVRAARFYDRLAEEIAAAYDELDD